MKLKKYIFRFRRIKLFFNTVIQNLGDFRQDEELQDSFESCTIGRSMSEVDFYKTFMFMKIGLSKAMKNNKGLQSLTLVNVNHMALMLSKGDDFVMPSLGRNSVQGQLATESNRSLKSFYSSITRLKKAGFLVVTEDNLIEPNDELKQLRKITRKHLTASGVFPLSYVINFIVTE